MQDTLAELISSRICHDLISPVGAIGNGLELLEAMGKTSPELELVGLSAQSAQAKLKFFRLAFGAAGGAMVGGAEARRVAEEMFAAGRMKLAFTQSWGERERGLVKLLYLLLLCVETSLPRGGAVRCSPGKSGWEIRVENTPIAPPEGLWPHVQNGQNGVETTAKTIHFALARQTVLALEVTLSLELESNRLRVEF